MTTSIGQWARRTGFLPWGLGFVLFLAYDIVLGNAVTGRTLFDLGVWAWLLVWLPNYAAQLFAPKGGYLFHPHVKDEPPPRFSGALTGICWALTAAGVLLIWTNEAAARQLALYDHERADGFINVVVLIFCAFILATVPSAAMRAHAYYAAQSRRLVEAESTRAVARTQVLQSQMQPHFLFNALNTVTALLREDPARGRDVLLRLRALLERSQTTLSKPMVALKEEIAFVSDQLAIEQERFRDRLTVIFEVDEALLTRRVPAFCIQPLVENALRHGIARSLEGGRIHVGVSEDASRFLRLEVRDTGVGLDPHWNEGTGLRNLRQRLADTYGSAATLTVTTHAADTVAVVTIPDHVPDPRHASATFARAAKQSSEANRGNH